MPQDGQKAIATSYVCMTAMLESSPNVSVKEVFKRCELQTSGAIYELNGKEAWLLRFILVPMVMGCSRRINVSCVCFRINILCVFLRLSTFQQDCGPVV